MKKIIESEKPIVFNRKPVISETATEPVLRVARGSRIEKKLLHYTQKAIGQFNMIQPGDRVMVCLSGGKDSFTLLCMLHLLREKWKFSFDIFAFTLDQAQPGWDDRALKSWLESRRIPYEVLTRDTYSIVTDKIPEGKTYCSLCSRLRRGIIYTYAEKNGYTKVALGHHRDDVIRTLLMSVFYNGEVRAMPPKLLTDNKKHIVIRPLVYCQEKDIIKYAQEQQFPIIPCTLCGSQENLVRRRVKTLIDELTKENPKIPSNILHAVSSMQPSQMMDTSLWNFKNLEEGLLNSDLSD